MIGIFIRRVFQDTDSTDDYAKTQQESLAVFSKPRRKVLGETNPSDTLVLDSRLRNCEKTNFWSLSHRVCHILLWQFQKTNTENHDILILLIIKIYKLSEFDQMAGQKIIIHESKFFLMLYIATYKWKLEKIHKCN